jgi:hypothetical protein
MYRHIWIAILFLGLIALSGCGDIEEMIEEATQQNITVTRTIHNSNSERDIKTATVMEAVSVAPGQAMAAGAASVDKLSERIEVSRLGLGEVRFFVRGHIRNLADTPALVTLSAIPNNNAALGEVNIGTITLLPGEDLRLENPSDMDQNSDSIHENMAAIFHNLDNDYTVNPVVEVQCAGNGGVIVDWVKFIALPTYWRTGELSPGGLMSYKKNVERIYDAGLEGSVKNTGDYLAEVLVYISDGKEIDPENDLIGHAFLEPGEKAEGFEILQSGGATKIKNAFKNMVNGQAMVYDFVVVSEQPLKVKSRNLRIKAKLTVQADIF